LKRHGTLDKEFFDVKEFAGFAEKERNGKFDILDGDASVFDDLSGTDLYVEVRMLLLEFGKNVFLDFVIDPGIDDKTRHCHTDDDE